MVLANGTSPGGARAGSRRLRLFILSAGSVIVSANLLFTAGGAYALPGHNSLEAIANASLEDLLDMKVTAVSKMPEELRRAPASVSVLTAEDIRRSGATSLPEVLRLIPGVNVARIDANKWSVSIRGFNGRTANKLLVMIDGRSIYDPFFSGTLWETKNPFMEDIERIEVVRGPGGSTWGANAMNGVINIITKHAAKTQGTMIAAGGGTEERAFSDVRYGAAVGDSAFYRVYGRGYYHDNGFPNSSQDDSQRGQGGFRFDNEIDNSRSYWIQGNGYEGDHDGNVPANDVHGKGQSVQSEYTMAFDGGSRLTLNGYYDHTDFDNSLVGEKRHTAEMNAQFSFKPTEQFELLSALQYRFTTDDLRGSEIFAIDPNERNDSLESVMSQGRYTVIEDLLDVRAGIKLEHNDYSGLELEPDAAATWTIDSSNTVWVSLSRAVRTPSRLENDFIISDPASGTTFVANRSLNAETLLAYELGYRTVPTDSMLLDVTAFYNQYDQLAIAQGTTLDNKAHGHTYGAEFAATWVVSKAAQLTAGYSLLKADLALDPDALSQPPLQIETLEGNSPENQFFVTVRADLGDSWELDTTVRYSDSLSFPHVSSYIVADVRLGYRITKEIMVDVIGQNLFRGHHFEQGDPNSTETEQAVYGRVACNF